MKPIIALLALLLLAAASPISEGAPRVCDAPGRGCVPTQFEDLRMEGTETWIEQTVTIDPEALPLDRAPMVWITAMASADIYWNGRLIGRNGRPGPDAASERPGLFQASFPVPRQLVRPGDNLLTVRLSSHHLWLPVRRPIHFVSVSLYETPTLPGLSYYLPAMLTLGALIAAFLYFGAAAAADRSDRAARLAAAIALLASAQLAVEVGRTFIDYAYPWHPVRVAGIALLAAATATAAAAYAAERFVPAWRSRIALLTAAAAAAALIVPAYYDLKALGAVLAGLAGILAAAAGGWRRRRAAATATMAGAAAFAVLMAWEGAEFLDGLYYVGVAAGLIALVAEQVLALRRARAERDRAAERESAMAARLALALETGETIVPLRNGGRVHRAPESDILFVQAADDYCEAALVDGRRLLVTQGLAKLLGELPESFLRVHKSYAVNRTHVARAAPRAGGGRELLLDDGTTIPVGRRYREAADAIVARLPMQH